MVLTMIVSRSMLIIKYVDKKLDGFNLEEIECILHNVCID